MNAYRTSYGYGSEITPAVRNLLIANVAVFVLQTLTGGGLTGRLGLLGQWLAFVPRDAVFGLEIWRFATYMFLHGGLWHLLFNMYALWMFGTQIERQWGSRTFLIYYFVCGLGGSITYGIFNLAGMGSYIPMIGASGAVYGILMAYGMFFPDAVILLFMVIPMKVKYAVILFGLIALFSSVGPQGSGGVAHLAHLGGMITGFIFLKVTIPSLGGGLGGLDPAGWWKRRQAKRRMRVFRGRTQQPGNGGFQGRDGDQGKGQDQAEIDRILDKISREGLQSLTEREQEILRRAGRR